MKQFETLIQFQEHFAEEATCRAHLAALRWGADGVPCCPFCGVVGAYVIDKGARYKCKDCRRKFSVTVGTVFEGTKLPLRLWFAAIYLACNSSKGISSLQLARNLGITQKTAWFLLGRIREAFIERAPDMLAGPVEVDETYMGGSESNRHKAKRDSAPPKTPVLGILQRDGAVRVTPLPAATTTRIKPLIRKHVSLGATVATDTAKVYDSLSGPYVHVSVNHGAGEYVRGGVHTNGIENFWSLFKRGVNGIYHQVSSRHLFRYCDEYAYRFNRRALPQAAKFDEAVRMADGKRLTYRRLIGKDQTPAPNG